MKFDEDFDDEYDEENKDIIDFDQKLEVHYMSDQAILASADSE